uniref:Uncharacterized protein n=1 Tax=Arion vulgaris TaxID=1028688 RepID=A0A0B6Z5N5_9EUPU
MILVAKQLEYLLCQLETSFLPHQHRDPVTIHLKLVSINITVCLAPSLGFSPSQLVESSSVRAQRF